MIRDSKRARATVYASKAGYRVTDEGDVISPRGTKLALNRYKAPRGGVYHRFTYRMPKSSGIPYEEASTTVVVHQLAAYQKFGELALSEGTVVRHKNGVSTDNKLSNILIGTHSDNMMDQSEDVRVSRAKHAASFKRRLTMGQARQLRRERALGWTYKRISEKYGIPKSSISYIVNGKTYAEIS